MATVIGTKKGLENMATQPASKGTINGVRIDVVALLVAGHPLPAATQDERRIALHVQRVGERMERQGWLPDLRRRRMLDVIAREAIRCEHPEEPTAEPSDNRGG